MYNKGKYMVISCSVKECKKKNVYMCIIESLCSTTERLAQHCKSAILWLKNVKK